MKIAATGTVVLALSFLMYAKVVNAQSPEGADAPPRSGTTVTEEYEGLWVTTKMKKLDGTTRCRVKRLDEDRWQGRFWGVWQQVPFDYTVEFVADADKDGTVTADARVVEQPGENRVRGTATIDGAHYDWVGKLTPAAFDIRFTGSRYHGHLELKRMTDDKSKR